jgi:nucleoside-diphosphate-sugar epimerase/SAM-dependent methyltransferase
MSSCKIAIVGATGYVGSALHKHLREQGYTDVQGFDRNPRAVKFEQVVNCPIDALDDESLRRFDVIIYLGGFSGRKECQARTPEEVDDANVQDVLRIAARMHADQLLLFASTSAIAEGCGASRHEFAETDEPDPTKMDAYTHSLFRRERAMEALVLQENYDGPKVAGLRFGTVVGASPSQKTEYVHVGMVRSALTNGRITVWHPETWRPFLWIQDQVRAFEKIIQHKRVFWEPERARRLHLYHMSSFNSTVGQAANEVAQALGVPQTLMEHHPSEDNHGFLLDNRKFQRDFNMAFKGTPRRVVDDLVKHGAHILVGREALDREQHVHDYVPCRVCDSQDLMEVLDLGEQPLANDFRRTTRESLQCERHPLRLMRCRGCNHAQLSGMVDRSLLFRNYSYRSGTSRTLDEYFRWLADKVDAECGIAKGGERRRVLELACNDGTQLNHFQRLGWETYGVDPATNIVPYAREQGHTIWTEMWGVSDRSEYAGMPDTFDAIVAQNVLAHVSNPVDFLKKCVECMHDRTRLYVQTSQCDMFVDGQFDTVYHEHISFFSPRSFHALAERVGLTIVRWEITPIHGRSFLVTMMKTGLEADGSLAQAMQLEEDRGQLEDAYYVRYRAQARATRDWLNGVLEGMYEQGHDVVGYGAAAKGMVLLHYMLAQKPRFQLSYVVDDAPLKQGTYCPGTTIPVKRASELASHDPTRPLTIIVFSWNFWTEIRGRIVEALNGTSAKHDAVWVVLPFYRQQVLILRGQDLGETATVQTNPLRTPDFRQLAASGRSPTVGMVTHFYNEELLLPYFIRHHAGMFDEVVMIDMGSNDLSCRIIADQAPSHWRVVDSKYPDTFDAIKLDVEVVEQENSLCTSWRIALTITEFIVHPDLRGELQSLQASNPKLLAMRFPALMMVGDDAHALQRFPNLIEQRAQVLREPWLNEYSRFLHRLPRDRNYYSVGRHALDACESTIANSEQGFLAKWKYTPWPESVTRKIQFNARIPERHVARGWGWHHNRNAGQWTEARDQAIREHGVADLRCICGTNTDMRWIQMSQAWCQVTHARPTYTTLRLPFYTKEGPPCRPNQWNMPGNYAD